MTTCKLITKLAILTLFFACDNNHHRRQNDIKRIVFATGGCYGPCPIQVIDLDSTLTFRYHGVKYTDTTGFYIGNISTGFWDTLNIQFESINYKLLDTSFQNSVDDLSTEIFIYYNDNTKHIFAQESSLPDSVMAVYNWLLTSIKQIKMQQTKDTLVFPTIIEKPLPIPIMETIKFIPPPLEDK